MTLSKERHQTLNEIAEDIMEYAEYIENIRDKYEDDEDYKKGDQQTKLATERVVAGLRQHMVNACREILDHEMGQKPNRRKETVKMCMEEGFC